MSQPKNSVLLVTTPDEWRPTTWHAVPSVFLATRPYATRLPLHTCIEIARAFNKHHSGARFNHEWAIVSCSLRRNPFKPRANLKRAVGYLDGAVIYAGDPDETPRSGVHDVGCIGTSMEGGAA